LASGAGLTLAPCTEAAPPDTKPAAGPTPLVHTADLFHPHGDPDDHFDLACAYALAARGCFDFRGIVIDYPPNFRAGDPALIAVAQMNWLTGMAVPATIGTSLRLANRRDSLANAPRQELAGVEFILRQLRTADRPVAIVCVGSAANIVVAALREPDLFKRKCAGVYLNSGSAYDNPAKPEGLEFNVKLDPAAYAALFDLPCPLYWCPCWHTTEVRQSGVKGSFYWLPHRDVLTAVSPGLANFFAYMFEKSTNPKWLRAMQKPPADDVWQKILSDRRGMWSTASQFAAAGLTVTRDGRILPVTEARESAVFRLVPVEITCADNGRTTWKESVAGTGRFMLTIDDVERYPAAMTRAVKTLFAEFGKTPG